MNELLDAALNEIRNALVKGDEKTARAVFLQLVGDLAHDSLAVYERARAKEKKSRDDIDKMCNDCWIKKDAATPVELRKGGAL